ncbi:MAG: hypothetical protein K8I60_04705, partial [Anaerolineae bacterium]|nr:hypothetical protein [Anaerolineae bacterium]
NAVIVSRPDGSQAATLFRPEEYNYFPQSYRWVSNTVLEYTYPGYLTDAIIERVRAEEGEEGVRFYRQYASTGQIALTRTFDVTTGQRSEPFIPRPLSVSVERLPTSIVSRQPIDGSFLLVSTPYPPYGLKYYIYNLQTGTYEYFARVDSGSLTAIWSPTGRYLYYILPGGSEYYVFDSQTGEHRQLGVLPPGAWSRDGRYRVSWYTTPSNEYRARLDAHQLPFKIRIWDSETGSFRRYCIPESGINTTTGSEFVWSPDGRYLAFTITLPPQGDVFPVPTPEVGIITATPSDPAATLPPPEPTVAVTPIAPVTLEQQYQYGSPRTLILDTQTGTVTVISTDVSGLLLWTDDGGSQ